uniref:SFRICE_006466 n=1 Tax=Spodoptera frugiperda TaxID=7108 RepID=A0A2H1WIS6_SPOFR
MVFLELVVYDISLVYIGLLIPKGLVIQVYKVPSGVQGPINQFHHQTSSIQQIKTDIKIYPTSLAEWWQVQRQEVSGSISGSGEVLLGFFRVFENFSAVVRSLEMCSARNSLFTLTLKTSKLQWSGTTLAGRTFHSLAVRIINDEPRRRSPDNRRETTALCLAFAVVTVRRDQAYKLVESVTGIMIQCLLPPWASQEECQTLTD